MAPTLYMIHASPPVRSVLITAKAIGLDLNLKEVDVVNRELEKPEFLKLNPQHTVPVLVDNDGFTVVDSHAIVTYLVSKYAKDDSLYPSDLRKRTTVNHRLIFDVEVVFGRLIKITKPIVFYGKTTIDQSDIDSVYEGYGFLNTYLEGHPWVAGDFISVADYSLITSVTSISLLVPVDPQVYPNVIAWIARVQKRPEYEANLKGLEEFRQLFFSKLNKS